MACTHDTMKSGNTLLDWMSTLDHVELLKLKGMVAVKQIDLPR